MSEPQQKIKSFEELTSMYQKFKLLAKIESSPGREEAKLDPVIKYVSDMCEEQQDDNTEFALKLRTIRASLLYDEARIYLSKQKVFIALEKLKKALHLVRPYKTNPKLTYLYFRVLNQLAYFLAQNNELEDSILLLEEAELVYDNLEDKTEILVFDTDDLFQEICPRKRRNALKFEKLVTNNYHLQGWIYNRRQLTDKFTVYYHMVLRRQLETQDSSALLWVFKCARLASYFYGTFKFREARYLLAASYYVLREYELDLLKRRSETHFPAEWANLQKYYADLGKYWVKYGLFLFDASRRSLPQNKSDTSINNILINSFKDLPPRKTFQTPSKILKEKLQTIEEHPSEDLPQNNESISSADEKGDTSQNALNAMNKDVAEITDSLIDIIDDRLKDEDNDRKFCVAKYISILAAAKPPEIPKNKTKNYQFVFPTLALHDIESKVTNELVTSLESARSVFLFTQDWLKRSKAYYSIQDYPLDYVNLILDLNDLYRFLSLYETTIDMQYDVQKRRVDLLEKLTQILKEYRPQFYLTLNIELVNELTQAQIELIILNLRRLNAGPGPGYGMPQQKEEIYRKMDALLDIRKRLNRKETFGSSYCENGMNTSLSETEVT